MEEFPLKWPLGYPVTESPEPNHNFNQWTLSAARKELLAEMNRLKPESFVISRNSESRRDGLPLSQQNVQKVPKGVAVYFTIEGEQKVLCCDAWDNWGDNMRALTLTVNALRGLERWGCSNIMKGAFSGLKELPASTEAGEKIWEVLMLSTKPASFAVVESSYKTLAKRLHPDIPGGSSDAFARLQEAFQKAKQIFGV